MLPTATEALRLFRQGALRPSELLAQVLAAVDALDGGLGAYVTVDRAGALAAAEAADGAWRAGTPGPLCGLPVSVKDIIDVAGAVTGCGSPEPRSVADVDATVVRRLREAGAVIVGKVHLHELALGITGENPRLGTPRNPRDRSRMPGGSSSGSAVSVVGGMAALSVGTDTGGSVRVPAALCGAVGFKPSFGRISRAGVWPLSWSMDHVGVIGRGVADVRLCTAVLDGEDPADPSTLELPRPAPPPGPPPRRVGLLELLPRASSEVREAVEATLGRLRQAGVVVEVVPLPMADELAEIYRTILVCEAATVHREALAAGTARFGDDVGQMLAAGAAMPATRYIQAMRRREVFAGQCDRLLARFECLLGPTTLVTAPRLGQRDVAVGDRTLSVREALVSCTSPFSMVGLPALSVPCAAATGLPVGLQLVGRRHQDAALLELGELLEPAGSD
jgi:aspartyl-tRNA(Asn)/glutamyl-tRNA(Gln) amidotransferase subunit A